MAKTFIINKEKYSELLLLCGHDTNHDFFEKLDPMKQYFQRGGSLGTYWTDPHRVGETRQGTPYLNSFIIDLDYEKVNQLIDNDYNIYTAISENNYENDPINVKTVIKARYLDYENIISRKMKALEKTKARTRTKARRTLPTIKDIQEKFKWINEKDMTPEELRVMHAVTTYLQGKSARRSKWPASSILTKATPKRRGGAPRVGTRARRPPSHILKKIEEAKSSIKKLIRKIKVWDGYVFKVRTQPEFYPDDEKFGYLHRINGELRGNEETVGDSLFLFSEWVNNKGTIKKSKLLTNKTLQSIYSDVSTVEDETEYLSKIYFGFYTIFDDLLKKVDNNTDLDTLFSDIKKFSLYTSSIDVGGDNIEDDDFSINIDTFVKKKWLKYHKMGHKNLSLIEHFLSDTEITLTKDEQDNIKALKYEIMGWWADNSGYKITDQNHWASKQFIRMKGGPGVESITDNSIRDDFLFTEFKIKKNQKTGIFNYNKENEAIQTPNVNDIIKDISERAFSNDAFSNNASSTKFYSDDGDIGRLKGLDSPIMFSKEHYNCNTVNVADPAPTCPECQTACGGVNLMVLNKGGDELIKLNINAKNKTLTNNSMMSYMINFENGKVLQGTKGSVNTMEGRKKVEGLSKSSVLHDVFSKMSTAPSLPRNAGRDTYSKTLQNYITNDHSIQELVEIFCFKLFGDFGQELYSVYQSFQGYSSYIGNDWISYIRYLFLKKNSSEVKRKSTFYPWYGGFLGNTSFNIIYQQEENKEYSIQADSTSSPAVSPSTSPTAKRSRIVSGGKGRTKRRTTRKTRKRSRRRDLPKLRILSYKNKKHKYKLNDPQQKRRKALDAGIRAERKTKKTIKKAATAKKARLNVLRIYRRNNNPKECDILTKDMKYIDQKYNLGKTKSICRKGRKKKSTRRKK